MLDTKTAWRPLPGSQTLALSCPAHIIIYHGTRGPGKTDAQLIRFRRNVGQGYGRHWRGIIFDREYKNLDDLVSKSMRWFPEIKEIGAGPKDAPRFLSSKSDYRWVWPTGEELLFRAVKRDTDYWGYHGQEFPFIGWNELTKFPTDTLFDAMMSCNRSSFRPQDFPIDDYNSEGDIIGERFLPEIPLEVFATCNPHGCVPFGEVLTVNRGWIAIEKVSVGEKIISVKGDGTACETIVSHVIAKEWKGEMILRQGRGMHMEFTSDHRLPHLNTAQDSFTIKRFDNLPGDAKIKRCVDGWNGTPFESFTVKDSGGRARRLNQPKTVNATDYAAFMGWFLSEGFTSAPNKAVGISQIKPVNRIKIENLLTKMGFKFISNFQAFTIHCNDWFEYLERFGKCRDKYIPVRLKKAPVNILRILLDALMDGDGHRIGDSGLYYTLSKQLADDVAEICVKLGYRVYIQTKPHRMSAKGLVAKRGSEGEQQYTVSYSQSSAISLHTGNHIYGVDSKDSSINVERTQFEGQVYCLTVPETETFFIRQNGCIWLSGNSGHNWVKKRFINVAPTGQIQKRVVNVFNPKTQQREDVIKTQVHLFGSYKENIYLAPEYIAGLESITDQNKRKAWLQGDWDIVAGGMFDGDWDRLHHVVKPFKIPLTWKIDRSFDWGSSKPFSVGWWAESDGSDVQMPDGTWRSTIRGDCFRIAEWYGWSGKANQGLNMLAHKVAAGIVEREIAMGLHGRVRPGPADNSIWDTENGNSIAVDMAKSVTIKGSIYSGITWIRSDKSAGSRKAGWEKMRKYLQDGLPQYVLDANSVKIRIPRERPGLFVFNTCVMFIDLVPILPRDEEDPDDVDTDSEDHIGDETRYEILSKAIQASSGKTKGT